MHNENTILFIGDKENLSARDKQRIEMYKAQGYEIVYQTDIPKEKMKLIMFEAHLLWEDEKAIIY